MVAPVEGASIQTGTDELGAAQDAASKLGTAQISAQESGL